jgi:hypothetical protein
VGKGMMPGRPLGKVRLEARIEHSKRVEMSAVPRETILKRRCSRLVCSYVKVDLSLHASSVFKRPGGATFIG